MFRYPFLLLMAIAMPFLLQAQQKPSFEKKTFVSPEGKLFIQKDLGLYLWLSTSADESSKKYKLESRETAPYANPMFLDTDGFNSFRSPSAVDPVTKKTIYPLQDVVFEVYADGSSPLTTISYGDFSTFVIEGKTYLMGNTKVILQSIDDQSGTENIYYSLDGKEFMPYTQPISFTSEKEYNLKYFAVDKVGNDERIHEINLVYDNSAPASSRAISNDEFNNILSARSQIVLKAEDKGIGVKKIVYKINESAEQSYQHPIYAASLSQGEHTLTYYAVDKVGNKEGLQTFSFYVDKTSPTIIEEIVGKSFFANGKEFSSGKTQLKLTAFDNKAGVKEIYYSINNGEYLLYTKPVFLTQASGTLDIKTYAVDNVNNKSVTQLANEKTSIPYIDLSGPTLAHTIATPTFKTRDTVFVSSKTQLNLSARDLEAGVNRIEYSINGAAAEIYEKPISLQNEGVHTISFIGYDQVENTNSGSFMVKVDNEGPSISHQFSTSPIGSTANGTVYPSHVILFLSGTDKVTGLDNIRYSFSDGVQKAYVAPITGLTPGVKTITIVASDKLGNTTQQEIRFEIK